MIRNKKADQIQVDQIHFKCLVNGTKDYLIVPRSRAFAKGDIVWIIEVDDQKKPTGDLLRIKVASVTPLVKPWGRSNFYQNMVILTFKPNCLSYWSPRFSPSVNAVNVI